ncbi:MAG: lamin tail domain-containing protein [Phycisphaerae bacterium]|nr:lamin tail domain-containing protein [Phycisphaerae bacterium]
MRVHLNLLAICLLTCNAVWASNTHFKQELAGDFNNDFIVNIDDLAILADSWLEDQTDGKVDIKNFRSISKNWQKVSNGAIVINEINYQSDSKIEPLEFIELYNASAYAIDISFWQFTDGVSYTFPENTTIAGGQYIIVAQDPERLAEFYNVDPSIVFGPFEGKLKNTGEEINLDDADGKTVDRVDYGAGFPWPTAAAGQGCSMELINPMHDNDLGSNWRSSGFGAETEEPQEPVILIDEQELWKYRKGTSEPESNWYQSDYQEGNDWNEGQASFGYKYTQNNTFFNDMRYNYTSVYLRKGFTIPAGMEIPDTLKLSFFVDDGCIIWVNGIEVTRPHVSSGIKYYDSLAINHNASWEYMTLNNANTYLHSGVNTIAVHIMNQDITSSDLAFDIILETSPDNPQEITQTPSPGSKNKSYSMDVPPNIRQVNHTPAKPTSNQPVTITAKISDDDGLAWVKLAYQIVDPGAYIPATLPNYPSTYPATVPNPDYEDSANWTEITMYDDGSNGDTLADDNIFSITLPEELQEHRRLIRYRIIASDSNGDKIQAPFADDDQQNFVYFVYDGVSSYTGAINPSSSDPALSTPVTYDAEVFGEMPTFHLISRENDIINCQYNGSYDNATYYFSGTIVYGDEIYDNIHYRIRGQASTFRWGKNKWKIKFNTARDFISYDDYGNEYKEGRDTLNIGTGTCPWWQYPHPGSWDRGVGGMVMNEMLAYRFYQLGGAEACDTNYIQLRVIDSVNEIDPYTQYDGDFWGLYIILEYADGNFLDERDMNDGNVFRMDSGANNTHQCPTQPTDYSDVNWLRSNINNSTPSQQWFQDNINLEHYYNTRAIGIAVHDSDRRVDSNTIYYNDSVTGKWWMIPWDLDLTFEVGQHYTTWENFGKCLNYPEFQIAYKNRGRELIDLLFNGEQASQLVDEISSFIYKPGQPSFIDAERARWDNSPRVNSYYRGLFYEHNECLAEKSFVGIIEYYKKFLTTAGHGDVSPGYTAFGVAALATEVADSNIPYQPNIAYSGQANYPINDLNFTVNKFSDPQGANTFAAMVWRIAEVEAPDAVLGYARTKSMKYEVNATYQTDEITTYSSSYSFDANGLEVGKRYRVRCKMKDDSGRYSHWSDPIEFVIGPAAGSDLLDNLRVSELMYHPGNAIAGEMDVDSDEFEFIELTNIGDTTLDLTGVLFTEGISFSFTGSNITSLAPGEFVLAVKNVSAFQSRYGTALDAKIAGQYDDKLSNGGEMIKLEDIAQGVILSFTYDDSAGWPVEADGDGYSLVPIASAMDDQDQGILDLPDSWQLSAQINGNPGQ